MNREDNLPYRGTRQLKYVTLLAGFPAVRWCSGSRITSGHNILRGIVPSRRKIITYLTNNTAISSDFTIPLCYDNKQCRDCFVNCRDMTTVKAEALTRTNVPPAHVYIIVSAYGTQMFYRMQ